MAVERKYQGTKLPNLLIVEDDPLLAPALCRLLKDICVTTIVSLAIEAWNKIEAIDYDGLLVEISLPGLHGRSLAWEFLERMLKLRFRVVLTFGGIGQEELQALQKHFACPVLYKPILPEKLLKTLESLFSSGSSPDKGIS